MAESGFDYLVLGSSALAGLLAGLLASAHGRKVCLVGEPFSPFRLQTSLDISIAPVTRPQTLALLQRTAAETGRLVGGWGKGVLTRLDPMFIAETPESIAALGHFRQLAIALGYAVEPVADRSLAQGLIVRVRDAQQLGFGRFEPELEGWLTRLGVRHLARTAAEVLVRKDGTGRIGHDGLMLEAGQVVFAGDDAIIRHLPADSRDRSLVETPGSASLLEGGKPLPAPFLAYLDRGIALGQEARGRGIAAITQGDPATARSRLGSVVARSGTLRVAGEVSMPVIGTVDGAPYVGPARGGKAIVIAGLGMAGAFFAPAVARHLAGAATAEEVAWFDARGATRGNLRLQAADYRMVSA